MKRILFCGTVLFAVAQFSSAATCTSGTLASYLALGPGGCTIGNDVLSNFQTLAGQTGASEIANNAVVVTPGGGTSTPSLTFSTIQSVSTGGLVESIFTYQLSATSITSASLVLSNSSETVDGGVTDIVNFCAAGTFGPDGVDGCTGTAGSLLALDGTQNSDTSPLGPVSFVSVTNDFTVSGGTAGSAAGGTFADSFTATPEPASLFMAALAILVATTVRMYSKRKV